MDLNEFVAVIAAPKEPELKDFERLSVFAYTAEKDVLWSALGRTGVHPIYRALLAQALHRRVIEEELERERTRQKKLEEEARLEAGKEEPRPVRKRGR